MLGQLGLVLALGLGALGSAIGIGIAGQAAAGAWAKQARSDAPLSFNYIILLGMPISQTLYAMILMRKMLGTPPEIVAAEGALLLSIGLSGGLAEMFSAFMQGKIGAAAIRCLAESGKGFAFLIIAMGIVETVGILGLAFLYIAVPG
ncbi:MAG: V-type ATP synthase subunit K [Deltaproteobacteria bacterium]|nr:V-type ATP synthase subunit K [Deltaproteobacteria bacterium]